MTRKKQEVRGNITFLAKLLEITPRRVNQLINENVIAKEAEGDFILPKAISSYYTYKLADKEVDYNNEKAKHERAKRQLAEMEVRKRKNELHEAADVEAVLSEMLVNLRTQLLGIPSKMAMQIAGKTADEIEEILTKEIEFILLDIKDYTPTMFEQEADERGT